MEKSSAIMELMAGYEAYSTAEEIGLAAAVDAPATTPACAASAAVSWMTSQIVSKTVVTGC
ncbi:LxmA leader domain family RiPP [Kitasatospora sp. HPMI-4]|uniref:LxmA leader domain family RiPP n=1 Tax=Kitasatospora sp. HPMI-4 TaxID=3448443 RepID=UPI003F19AF8A